MKKFQSLVNGRFERFLLTLSTLKTTYLVAFCVCVNVVISYIFSVVADPVYDDPLAGLPFGIRLFTLVLLAPVIETILFQKFLISGSLKFIGGNKLVAILLSALVFGLAHHYSAANIFKAFLSGLLYGFLYVAVGYKNKNPVLYVTIAHAAFNSIGFIVTNL